MVADNIITDNFPHDCPHRDKHLREKKKTKDQRVTCDNNFNKSERNEIIYHVVYVVS